MAGAFIIYLALIALILISAWKVYVKAGQPGWGCLIPIYNIYLLLVIAGKPTWWIILFFIPIANLVASILMWLAIAENFGKSSGFGIGLVFLSIIFLPILAFGSAKYGGSRAAGPPAIATPSTPPPPPTAESAGPSI